MQFNFGAGNFFAVPGGANPTPVKIGSLQEAMIEFSGSIKEGFGQYQYALVAARGQVKVSGKAKFLNIRASAYNSLFLNNTVVAGQTCAAIDEVGNIPGSVAYTVTVANSTTWVMDLGVTYGATGIPMTCGASASAVGIYSVAAGVYTFNVGDKGLQVYICYTYTVAAGYTINLQNALMGQAPTFMGLFTGTFSGKQTLFKLNNIVGNKLTPWSTKLEDFVIPEFDYTAYVDASNTLGIMSSSE